MDLFHIVDDPSNTPINKKVTAKNVFNNIPTYIGLAQASESATNTDTAINTTSAITEVNQTAAVSLSLADGTDGQIKTVIIGTGSNNIVITPTNLRGGSTITLNAGETVQCLFKNSKWNVIGGHDFVVN